MDQQCAGSQNYQDQSFGQIQQSPSMSPQYNPFVSSQGEDLEQEFFGSSESQPYYDDANSNTCCRRQQYTEEEKQQFTVSPVMGFLFKNNAQTV